MVIIRTPLLSSILTLISLVYASISLCFLVTILHLDLARTLVFTQRITPLPASRFCAHETNRSIEITNGLDLLWRNDIDSAKVVLGLGFYGRSFTLKDPTCNKPGCAFSGGGIAGNCSAASGILSNAEIQRIITQYDLTPTLDTTAAVKYMSWNSDQWCVALGHEIWT